MFRLQFCKSTTFHVGILAALTASCVAAGFTPGNVVALRVGDGTTNWAAAGNTTSAAPVFLDEYPCTGTATLVQSINLTATGVPNPITLVGNYAASNFDGVINMTEDGQYIIVGGYNAAVGTAGVAATTANTVPRVIARVRVSDGSVDTSVQITTSAVVGNVRAAAGGATSDTLYAAFYQQASPNASNTWYTNSTMAGDAVPIMATSTGSSHAMRSLNIFGGNIYAGLGNLGAGNPNGLFRIGTGFPTSTNNALTTITGALNPPTAFTNMEQVAFESYETGLYGRIYAADQVTAQALTRWDYDGTNYTKTSNIGTQTILTFGTALGQDTEGTPVILTTVGSANPNNSIRMARRSDGVTTTVVQALPAGTGSSATFRGIVVIPDVAPPSITTMTLAGANPTGFSNLTFNVTFNQPVYNLQSTNFTKTGSLSGTGTIGNPTTVDNITWTVPVNGVSGIGTLGIDKTSNNYVQDATGNKLTGSNIAGPQYSVFATAAQNWSNYE